MSSFAVGDKGLASLSVTGDPSPWVAGVAHDVTVTAKDLDGNTFTGYTGTVSFTSSDSRATLPASYPFTAGDNGVYTFSGGVKLNTGSRPLLDHGDRPGERLLGVAVRASRSPGTADRHRGSEVEGLRRRQPGVHVRR